MKIPSQSNSLSWESSEIKKSLNETYRKNQTLWVVQENARLWLTLSQIKPVMDRKEWEKFEHLSFKFWNMASKFNEQGENKDDAGI